MLRCLAIPNTLSRRSGPLAAGLLLLLAMGAAPAHATTLVINSAYSGPTPLFIGPGDRVNIVDGGSLWGAVIVDGGTLNMTGGSIGSDGSGVVLNSGTFKLSGGSITGGGSDATAVIVYGGTASISGGSISGLTGMEVPGGTVNISGGSVAGSVQDEGGAVSVSGGVVDFINLLGGTVSISGGSISDLLLQGGTVSIYGCGLTLSGSNQITGTLLDGTPINLPVFERFPTVLNLINKC